MGMGFGINEAVYTYKSKVIYDQQKKITGIGFGDPSLKTKHSKMPTRKVPYNKTRKQNDRWALKVILVLSAVITLIASTVIILN